MPATRQATVFRKWKEGSTGKVKYFTVIAVCWTVGMSVGLERLSWVFGLLVVCAYTAITLVTGQLKRSQWISLSVVVCLSLSSAWGYASWVENRNISSIPQHMEAAVVTATGQIVSSVEIDGDRVRFVLRTSQVDFGQGVKRIDEKLQVQIRLMEEPETRTAEEWRRGDRIQLQGELKLPSEAGNFGAFDYRSYLHDQGIHWQLSLKGISGVSIQQGEKSDPQAWLGWRDQFQKLLADQLDSIYEEPFSGFLKGLLIGYRDDLNEEQFNQFSSLGLTHILAISGLHVGVLASIMMLLCRWLKLTRETSYTISMIWIPIYVLLTGASPSAVRAGIMTVLALYAMKRQLLGNSIHLVALAAVMMTLWNPYFIVGISFQLSFIVTLGLIICTPVVYSFLPDSWWKSVRSLLSVTITAQWISFPISIYYFNSFSLLSGLANFLIVPFISTILFPGALLSFALSFLWPWLGKMISAAVVWGLELVFNGVELLASFDRFHLVWSSPRLEWILVYFALSLWLIYEMKGYQSEKLWEKGLPFDSLQPRRWVLCTGVLALLLMIGYQYISPWTDSRARIYFIDVGQGDSTLIVTPSQQTILIDGGGTLSFMKQGEDWKLRSDPYEVGQDLLVPLLKKRGIRDIDLMIATHGDTDHIGGLRAVIESFPVHAIWMNGTYDTGGVYEEFLELAMERGIPIYSPTAGERYSVDDETRIEVLLPVSKEDSHHPYIAEKQNDVSVVLMLEVFGRQLLFTGDIGEVQEREWLRQRTNRQEGVSYTDSQSSIDLETATYRQQVDIMKVAHHGSKYSTSDEWLSFWNPTYSVISAGRNNVYGHPTEEVLQRLNKADSSIFRTDQHGEIQIFIDEENMEIRTKLSQKSLKMNVN
ncbi:DNA internalization-related competence protein ComEC/Rec2 [Marinicrinis lubricantis]